LYGRGVAKEQLGDRAGADADIAAAREIDPDIGKKVGRQVPNLP
jgi:Flp pilus assembly protein TadD